MLRKQLYITAEIDRELTLVARRGGRSVAEVVREILTKGLKVKHSAKNSGSTLLKMAKEAGRGPKDLSKNFSSYLYGNKSFSYGKNRKDSR